jgi:hypothetical protein
MGRKELSARISHRENCVSRRPCQKPRPPLLTKNVSLMTPYLFSWRNPAQQSERIESVDLARDTGTNIMSGMCALRICGYGQNGQNVPPCTSALGQGRFLAPAVQEPVALRQHSRAKD